MVKEDPNRIFWDENYSAWWRIHWINSRLDVAEENTCEREDIVVETTHNEIPKKNKNKNKISNSDLWENIKEPNICVVEPFPPLKKMGNIKDIWISNGWNYPKFDENYQPRNLRSSIWGLTPSTKYHILGNVIIKLFKTDAKGTM